MVQTLRIIFDRGLIGIYCDWCESLNTYPRTYDLLHPAFLFQNLTERYGVTPFDKQFTSVQTISYAILSSGVTL